jgi:vacuolar-type H+-ATPase subunit H
MEGNEYVSLREHHDAVLAERTRRYDERRAADLRFADERDRRYTEVAAARAEALKIKEEADRKALDLAREYQSYKDEKDNRLREQITSERGGYATHSELNGAVEKIEATLAPILAYVAAQQGRSGGLNAGWGYLVGLIVVVNIIIGIVLAFLR